MKYKLIKSMIWIIIAGIGLTIFFIIVTGYDEASKAASLLKYQNWIAILSLTLLHIILRFARWQYYLLKLEHKVKTVPSLAYYLSGFALTMTPGKIGETLRSVYLKSHGVSYTDSISAFFVERYTDLLAVIALSTLILAHYSGHQSPVIIVCLLVLTILLIVRGPWFITLLERLQRSIKNQRIRTGLIKLAGILNASSRLLSFIPLSIGFIIALIAWAIQGLVFYLILGYIDHSVSLYFAVGVYSLAILGGAVSFLPGGLGSTEAVMILLLLSIGISAIDATTATLVTRVATLWFAVAIGLCALAYVELHRRRKYGDNAV